MSLFVFPFSRASIQIEVADFSLDNILICEAAIATAETAVKQHKRCKK